MPDGLYGSKGVPSQNRTPYNLVPMKQTNFFGQIDFPKLPLILINIFSTQIAEHVKTTPQTLALSHGLKGNNLYSSCIRGQRNKYLFEKV